MEVLYMPNPGDWLMEDDCTVDYQTVEIENSFAAGLSKQT